MTRVEFIMAILADRFNRDGWVIFAELEPYGILPEFTAYCARHGCTLTTLPGDKEAAPWSDFYAFMLNVRPAD